MSIPQDVIDVIQDHFPIVIDDIIDRFDPYLIFGRDTRGEYLSVVHDEIKEIYIITIFTSGQLTNTRDFYVDFESKKTQFGVKDAEDLRNFFKYYEVVYAE